MTMISKSPKDPVVALTNGWIFVFIHFVNAEKAADYFHAKVLHWPPSHLIIQLAANATASIACHVLMKDNSK